MAAFEVTIEASCMNTSPYKLNPIHTILVTGFQQSDREKIMR
jgi:hypothetical protein